MKLPGIKAVKSLFAVLAFAPDKSKHVQELYNLGGCNYMRLRAMEMLQQYSETREVKDLDMAIQLLSAVRILMHSETKPSAKEVDHRSAKTTSPPTPGS